MRIPIVSGLLTLCLLSFSCHQPSALPPGFDTQKALGSYEGKFGEGVMTLIINYFNGNIVSGYEIHKGIRRNVNGSVNQVGDKLELQLKEPGNYAMDGSFDLAIDTGTFAIVGKWKPLKAGVSQEKDLVLKPHEAKDPMHDISFMNFVGENGKDTLLEFKDEGVCSFNFYKNPSDSTSQRNTVTGSYVQSGDTIKVEWQRNPYTPAQQMTLYIIRTPYDMAQGDTLIQLVGHGWKLQLQVGGDDGDEE